MNNRELTGEVSRRIQEILRLKHSFVLTTHQDPDGDGVGSEVALADALLQLGKSVQVINTDHIPVHYRFLSGCKYFGIYQPEQHDTFLSNADVVVVLDAALPERTGRLAPALERTCALTIAIDHHQGGGWAQFEIIDPTRSATVELIYEILTKLPININSGMAEALYTGLISDTQSFCVNTTSEAHILAASLLQKGVLPERINNYLFYSWDLNRLRLLGEFLAHLHLTSNGLIVWGRISLKDMERLGQERAAIEGFVEQALKVGNTKIAALFLEEPGSMVRVSLRSRGGIEVESLARALGGGGHPQAAGTKMPGDLREVTQDVLHRARLLVPSKSAK